MLPVYDYGKYQGTDLPPMLQDINLALSAVEIFSWLALPERTEAS